LDLGIALILFYYHKNLLIRLIMVQPNKSQRGGITTT